MSEKIDFVVTWVDGSDPEWLQQRNTCTGEGKEYEFVQSQYRDWDILKYWFRGVDKFTPWVNKIYFVTWGHIPSFLDVSHPKIVIVKHEDFIPKEYLPTFSSHVIETNLHRIKGLSNQFVYFNDDIFVMRDVQKEDFFKNSLPRDTAVMNPIAPARYDSISSLMVNNIGILNEHFDKKESMKSNLGKWFNVKYGILNLLNLLFLPWSRFVGLYEQHTATSFLKDTYIEVWEKEYDILDATGKNKVRNFKTDVNQWLFKNWRIVQGNFIPRKSNFSKYLMVSSLEKAKETEKHLRNQSHHIICVNDHYKGQNLDEIISVVQNGFEAVLSEKSTFEL